MAGFVFTYIYIYIYIYIMKEYYNYIRMIYAGSTLKIRAMGKKMALPLQEKKLY